MEARKITIVQTKNQKKSVIMTSATTLGELKDDLRTNGIDYEDMTFYEGLSKTELKTDESILPHDIERNGVITNELVFMLTNTNKKIKSGATSMSRKDIYAAIRGRGLQDKCFQRFGRNYTQCSTAALLLLIEDSIRAEDAKPKEEKSDIPVSCESCNCKGYTDIQARTAISELVETLKGQGVLRPCSASAILNILGGIVGYTTVPTSNNESSDMESPYTQDEINQMFRGMR